MSCIIQIALHIAYNSSNTIQYMDMRGSEHEINNMMMTVYSTKIMTMAFIIVVVGSFVRSIAVEQVRVLMVVNEEEVHSCVL